MPGDTRKKFIKAQVVSRTDVKQFTSGKGKLFSADFADEKGGQLRGTFFNELADEWNDTIRRGDVYRITGFTLKAANAKFAKPGSKWEMSIDDETKFEPLADTMVTPLPVFVFTKIANIKTCKPKDTIDVVGLINEVQDYKTSIKDGKESFRRVITISDESMHSVDVTIWGKEHKDTFDMANCRFKLLAMKDCTISYFANKVSLNNGAIYLGNWTEKDIPSAAPTVAWSKEVDPFEFKSTKLTTLEGVEASDLPMTGVKRNLKEVKDLKLEKDKSEYSIVYANVIEFARESKGAATTTWYHMVCPKPGCGKKLTAQNHCETCNKTCSTGIPKYALRVKISDMSSGLDVSVYGDQAQKLLGGLPVEKLLELDTEKTRAEFNAVLGTKNIGRPFNFKIQSKGGMHKEKNVIWHTVSECLPAT